jgi:hypothetical protein
MRVSTILIAAALFSPVSCHKAVPLPEPTNLVPEPPASQVDNVVILVGDMGDALWDRSPLPHRMAGEVERWSRALRNDSSVTVLFLGDNIYPRGLRTEPQFFAVDSSHLQAQVDILGGPNARQYSSFGLFIAGNHDWGLNPGPIGEQRVRNQEEFIARRRAGGVRVQLLPKAGTPGPGIVDVGRKLRFILLDTAWWLLSADAQEKTRTMTRLQDGMKSRGTRSVIMAAHHPMKSASAHGGLVSLWDVFGLKWLLNKSGASLQDLNSLPYRDLLKRLDAAFQQTGPPLIFAGGHDHSIQLMHATRDVEPRFMIVSGAGSKSSRIGTAEGMEYRSMGPGYTQLLFMKDGGVDLAVYTAPPEYLICAPAAPAALQKCMQEGIAAFKRVYSTILK